MRFIEQTRAPPGPARIVDYFHSISFSKAHNGFIDDFDPSGHGAGNALITCTGIELRRVGEPARSAIDEAWDAAVGTFGIAAVRAAGVEFQGLGRARGVERIGRASNPADRIRAHPIARQQRKARSRSSRRATLLVGEEVSAVMRQMSLSKDERTRQFADNLRKLDQSHHKGFNECFRLATMIYTKALASVRGGTKEKADSMTSEAKQEMRYEYQPFFDASSSLSYDTDLQRPVEGNLEITELENECIQASLMMVLNRNFPAEMESLTREDALLRRSIESSGHDLPVGFSDFHRLYASDYPDWHEDMNARELFDEISHLALPDNLEIDAIPLQLHLALDKVGELPDRKLDMPILPRDEARPEHSFRAEALQMLAAHMNFNSGDHRGVFDRITAQMLALPHPVERSLIRSALWETSRQYIDACQADIGDAARVRKEFDNVVSIMSGLQIDPSSGGSSTTQSDLSFATESLAAMDVPQAAEPPMQMARQEASLGAVVKTFAALANLADSMSNVDKQSARTKLAQLKLRFELS